MTRKRVKKQEFNDIVEKYGKQLIIGSIVLIAALGILSNQILKKKPSVIVSPTPTIAVTPSVTTTPQKTTDTAREALTNKVTTPAPKLVTKLPLTKGETISYIVKKNDSIAKLGETFCNNKRAWITIAEDNNIYYPYTIQPGDILKISCPN